MNRPDIKDVATLAYVQYLEEELSKFKTSPYYKTYLTIYNQIESFNDQLTIRPKEKIKETRQKLVNKEIVDYEITLEIQPGKIDLFGGKDEKEFDRAWKYMLESIDINKRLGELRSLMSPEERDSIDKKTPLAEKLIKNSSGK